MLMDEVWDKYYRLLAMVKKDKQVRNLSPRDVEAIRMAVDVLELLIVADRPESDFGLRDLPSVGAVELRVAPGVSYFSDTVLGCFVDAATGSKCWVKQD
jgi:hypothetical protein